MPTPPTIEELPLRRDYVIYQGGTFKRAYRWVVDGVGRDLSDWTGAMQVRKRAADPVPQLTLTTENGGITLAADGTITIYATDELTAAMTSSGVYDVKLENADGEVITFMLGEATLIKGVTR